MDYKKKILSLVLVVLIFVSTLTSCNNITPANNTTTEHYYDSTDAKDLVSLMVDAFYSDNIVDVKKYGYVFFFSKSKTTNLYYEEFVNYLCKKYNVDKNNSKVINSHYDLLLVTFQISLLYDSNGEEIDNYSAVLTDFKKADALLKSEKNDLYYVLTTLYDDELIKKDFFVLYLKFLHFYLPYSSGKDIFAIMSFLQSYAGEFREEVSISNYVLSRCCVNGGIYFDKSGASQIYSVLTANSKYTCDVTLEDTINYITAIDAPLDVLSCEDFFGTKPSYYEKNCAFYFNIEESLVVFYGVPTVLVEIVDCKTGEIYFSRHIYSEDTLKSQK